MSKSGVAKAHTSFGLVVPGGNKKFNEFNGLR
jgi:hypothetical protein